MSADLNDQYNNFLEELERKPDIRALGVDTINSDEEPDGVMAESDGGSRALRNSRVTGMDVDNDHDTRDM